MQNVHYMKKIRWHFKNQTSNIFSLEDYSKTAIQLLFYCLRNYSRNYSNCNCSFRVLSSTKLLHMYIKIFTVGGFLTLYNNRVLLETDLVKMQASIKEQRKKADSM